MHIGERPNNFPYNSKTQIHFICTKILFKITYQGILEEQVPTDYSDYI